MGRDTGDGRSTTRSTRSRVLGYALALIAFVPAILPGQTSPGGWEYAAHFLPSQNSTFALMEDSRGYIWSSGTGGILYRYDGAQYRTYTRRDGLVNTDVFHMKEDRHGRIWLLQWACGLWYLDGDTVRSFEGNRVLKRLMEDREFPDNIYIDEKDTIWITSKKRTCMYRCWNDTAVEIDWDRSISSDSMVCFIRRFRKQDMMVCNRVGEMRHAELKRIDGGFRLAGTVDPAVRDVHCQLVRLHNGRLLVTFGTSLLLFDTNRSCPISTGRVANDIEFVYEDHRDNIWLGTSNGAYRFRKGDIASRKPDHLFPGRYINYIMQDRIGSFWLADRDNGTYYIPNISFRLFRLEGSGGSQEEGATFFNARPPKLPVVSMQTHADELWFTDLKGNVYVFDSNFVCRRVVEGQDVLGTNVESRDFLRDADGRILVGQRTRVVDPIDMSCRVLNAGGAAKTYLLMRNGRTAIGMNFGFEIFSGVEKVFDSDSLGFSVWTQSLFNDEDGSLWIGSDSGVFRFDGAKLDDYRSLDPIYRLTALGICRSPESGYLILATDHSGIAIDKGGEVSRIGTTDGLPSATVTQVYPESDTLLWAATAAGLSRIVIRSWKPFRTDITTYTSKNGLPGDYINDILVHRGSIWLATDGGLCRFRPAELELNLKPPPVYITKFSVNDSTFDPLSSPRLTADRNNIGIGFVGICFRTMGSVRYRYRLLGGRTDSGWKETTDRHLQFLSLPAGTYQFQVSAANEDGVWNPNPAILRFAISPHVTETLWFRIGLLISVVCLTAGTAWRVVAGHRRKSAIDAQIRELRQKMLGANMNPHFIFNSLSSIQDYINQHNLFEANEYLAQFSRLIRLNMETVQKSFVSLEEEIERLRLYLSLEELRFGDRLSYGIAIDRRIDPDHAMVPTMLIQPYVENAIWHGILPLQRPGRVDLFVEYVDEKKYVIRIVDDGVGLSNAAGVKVSKHTSLSMKLNGERLELLAVSMNLPFSIRIADRREEDGRISGTVAEIFLPLNLPGASAAEVR